MKHVVDRIVDRIINRPPAGVLITRGILLLVGLAALAGILALILWTNTWWKSGWLGDLLCPISDLLCRAVGGGSQ